MRYREFHAVIMPLGEGEGVHVHNEGRDLLLHPGVPGTPGTEQCTPFACSYALLSLLVGAVSSIATYAMFRPT